MEQIKEKLQFHQLGECGAWKQKYEDESSVADRKVRQELFQPAKPMRQASIQRTLVNQKTNPAQPFEFPNSSAKKATIRLPNLNIEN